MMATRMNELKERRKALGMTQQQVAERCGMSRENYARIERGAASTTLATLQRVADALGLRVTFQAMD